MATTISAAPLLTTRRVAPIGDLTLASGDRLENVNVGYETYGTLNERKDNAILICHYFGGSSHAAGRYRLEDDEPGWWDAIIGPGKTIDTDRYFVVSIEALGCVRIDMPHGVTTGPQSIDPRTNRPYGPMFPPITVSDMVEAQRKVLDQLGVERLAMVAGPSLGAMLSLQWAVQRPGEVDRVVACIALPEFQAKETGLYRVMLDAIRLDPKFKGGAYDPQDPPVEGLAVALKLMMVLSNGRDALHTMFGHLWADPSRDPYQDPSAEWAIEAWLDRESRVRASLVDANAWIAMLRTHMRWDLSHAYGSLEAAMSRVRGRVLLLPGRGDEFAHMTTYHFPLMQALKDAGVDYHVHTLPAVRGHMAGLADIDVAASAISVCLEAPLKR